MARDEDRSPGAKMQAQRVQRVSGTFRTELGEEVATRSSCERRAARSPKRARSTVQLRCDSWQRVNFLQHGEENERRVRRHRGVEFVPDSFGRQLLQITTTRHPAAEVRGLGGNLEPQRGERAANRATLSTRSGSSRMRRTHGAGPGRQIVPAKRVDVAAVRSHRDCIDGEVAAFEVSLAVTFSVAASMP